MTKTTTGLSMRAYARRRGVSEAAIRKAVKSGRITRQPDGLIDPSTADAQWEATALPSPHSPSAALPNSPSYHQARTAHEVLKVQTGEVRLKSLKGILIDRDKAAAHVFALARAERDSWLNWPSHIASLMAKELGVEAHQMQMTLEHYVREHLFELATFEPDFPEV